MGATTIEWAEHSINPFKARNLKTGAVGHWCVKISGGCKNCYASRQQSPYLTQIEYRAENRPLVELFFDEKAIDQVLRRRKPTRYFWEDMSDLFLDEYPDEWIDRCFAAMALTPQHTHMVLTKRSGRMRKWSDTYHDHGLSRFDDVRKWVALMSSKIKPEFDWPLPNVWLGVSVEDRAHLPRIDDLRETPAAVRFLSLEPLLEDLGQLDLGGIDWVIAGGESGPGARSGNIAWARRIIRQCRDAEVPCFMKQLGANPVIDACRQHHYDFGDAIGRKAKFSAVDPLHPSTGLWRVHLADRKGSNPEEWPLDLRVREMPEVRR